MKREGWLLIALGAAGILWFLSRTEKGQSIATDIVGGIVDTLTPRGIRNNNPGNIRYNGSINWQGQVGKDADGYVIFDTAAHGVRALAKDLQSKFNRGLDTVEKIISVYAPPTENNTAAYIKSVATALNVNPSQSLNVTAVLPDFAAAIIKHENGQQPYAPENVAAWVRLA